MLSVISTKDISNYKTDVVGGFDLKETISIGIGLVIGIVIFFICFFGFRLPIFICPYIAAPFVAVPIINQFYTKNGMNFFEAKKRERQYKVATCLPYESSENASNYMKYYLATTAKQNASGEDEFDLMVKKLKKMGILSAIIFIVMIVAAIVLKSYL